MIAANLVPRVKLANPVCKASKVSRVRRARWDLGVSLVPWGRRVQRVPKVLEEIRGRQAL